MWKQHFPTINTDYVLNNNTKWQTRDLGLYMVGDLKPKHNFKVLIS